MTMAILRSQTSNGEDEEEDIIETDQISIEVPMNAINLPHIPFGRSSTETLKVTEDHRFKSEVECPYKNLTKVCIHFCILCSNATNNKCKQIYGAQIQ